ncbi:MAG: hypothetical protein EA412_06600 [Chitinophagaceae bacterium]|nr:MAG: hypothetical protein EA412_06600 [Chitinophagaceae bacterium]
MYFELPKSQKKIARQVIEKGLQKEFVNGLKKVDGLIEKWKSDKLDNREAYHKVYAAINEHDKHIGRRYDYMSGSKYLLILAAQLADNVITINDLKDFNDDVREKIISISNL